MELVQKSYARSFKTLCVISILAGAFMAIRAFTFAPVATQLLTSGGLGISGIGVIVLVIALLVPAMLILAGVFGYMNKLKASIACSIIALVISLYSLITNIITLSMVSEWRLVISNLIPMVAVTATSLLLVIYAILTKKHPQD